MDSSPVVIRQAHLSDIKSLVSLLKVLFSIEEDFVFNEEKQYRGLMALLADERACILVAEIQGEVVGMCSGQLTSSTAEGGPALLVEDVVVQENFREIGTGRKLMNEITRWAQKKGVFRLQLLADQNNKGALEFYRKQGWQSTQLICLRKKI